MWTARNTTVITIGEWGESHPLCLSTHPSNQHALPIIISSLFVDSFSQSTHPSNPHTLPIFTPSRSTCPTNEQTLFIDTRSLSLSQSIHPLPFSLSILPIDTPLQSTHSLPFSLSPSRSTHLLNRPHRSIIHIRSIILSIKHSGYPESRLITLLLYLTDMEGPGAGGETAFPKGNILPYHPINPPVRCYHPTMHPSVCYRPINSPLCIRNCIPQG